MVVGGAALFGLNATASKLTLGTGIDAPQLTTIRATGAAVGLFALTAVTGPRRLRLNRREVPLLLGYGVSSFFLIPMLYFIAISRLPVGVGVLFEYTAPLLLALWVRFVQRRAVRSRLWIGLIACLVGLAGVAQLLQFGPGLRLGVDGRLRLDGLGVAAALTAACLLVSYYLIGERAVRTRDPMSLTAYAFGVSAIAGAVVRPWWRFDFGAFGRTADHGLPVWALVLYVVIGGSIAPYLLFNAALRHVPATSVGIIGMLEPVFAAAVAWLALSEHLTAGQLAGGLLILGGVALAETARVKRTEPPLAEAGPLPAGTAVDEPPSGKPANAAPVHPADISPGKAATSPGKAAMPPGGSTARPGKMEPMELHPNVQAVQDALDAADVTNAAGDPCRVQILPDAVHTAPAAAAALGVEVGQIANSLIFTAVRDGTGEPLLILTSGAHRVDTAKIADRLGVKLKRAQPDFVREHTGQVIGGVSPLGHPKPLPTLVDTALAQYDEIWAAGGVPQAVFPITYAELVRVTSGTPTDVA
jgi:drug/metabolite transporter (DMT)-like permease/prolyl-tRNA editing enzyme YbaK/EbsC (Cys-tRNA(Pro) deacylase)